MTLTQPRVHIAVAVSDLDLSVGFYERMFGLAPVKKRLGYVKFELSEPRLNFTLNEAPEVRSPGGPAHYGIELPTPTDVAAFALRVRRPGPRGQCPLPRRLPMLRPSAVAACVAARSTLDRTRVGQAAGRHHDVWIRSGRDPAS